MLATPEILPSRPIASRIDFAVLFAFGIASSLLVAGMSVSAPQVGRKAVIIYPPWTSSGDAITRASATGARLVGAGRYPFIVVAVPGAAPNLNEIKASGALFVLDAEGLAGCLIPAPRSVS